MENLTPNTQLNVYLPGLYINLQVGKWIYDQGPIKCKTRVCTSKKQLQDNIKMAVYNKTTVEYF